MRNIYKIWSGSKRKWYTFSSLNELESFFSGEKCLNCRIPLKIDKEAMRIRCPKCGGSVGIVAEKDVPEGRDWVEKALIGNIIHKETNGEDFSLWTLSARLPSDVWEKVKEYFNYYGSEEMMEGGCDFWGESFRGWATTAPEKVEQILREEAEKAATPLEREEVEILQEKERALMEEVVATIAKKEQLRELVSEVDEAFRGAEIPDPKKESPEEASKYMSGFEKMKVSGESIDDPFNETDIYGSGHYWTITPEHIWSIEIRGMDGDDWSRNNVETGGAGGIGWRIPRTEELVEKIRKIREWSKEVEA